jgi:hypothetical protein
MSDCKRTRSIVLEEKRVRESPPAICAWNGVPNSDATRITFNKQLKKKQLTNSYSWDTQKLNNEKQQDCTASRRRNIYLLVYIKRKW